MAKKEDKPNLEARRTPPPRGMLGWLLQRLSAVVVFGIVVTHILVIHYTTPGEPITFAESVQRLQHPLFLSLWLILLGVGLYHVLYGLRNIILDFIKVRNQEALTSALFGVGIVAFGLGVFFLIPLILGKPLFGN